MLNKVLAGITIIAFLCILSYVIFIWDFGHHFANSYPNERNTSCASHEVGRISFDLKPGLDLHKMLDSFLVIHENYAMSDRFDSDYNHSNSDNCYCCCISSYDNKEIVFTQKPLEIYAITAGNTGRINIVSTYTNNKWRCVLTSQMDSIEKRRVYKRFNDEILSQLPVVKDIAQ